MSSELTEFGQVSSYYTLLLFAPDPTKQIEDRCDINCHWYTFKGTYLEEGEK